MIAVLMLALLAPSSALRAQTPCWDALCAASGAALQSRQSAASPAAIGAKLGSGEPFDPGPRVRVAEDDASPAAPGSPSAPLGLRRPDLVVDESSPSVIPPPDAAPAPRGNPLGIPPWLAYGGSAVIGAVSGWFTGGWGGAAVGAGLGVASAFLFERGDFGASIGMTVGGIIGTFFLCSLLGGPVLAGLVGSIVGGAVGHFAGGLF